MKRIFFFLSSALFLFLFLIIGSGSAKAQTSTLKPVSCTSNEISFDFNFIWLQPFVSTEYSSLGYFYNNPTSGGTFVDPVQSAYSTPGTAFPAGIPGMTYRITIPNNNRYYQNGDTVRLSMSYINWVNPTTSGQMSCIFDPTYTNDDCNHSILTASCTYFDLEVAQCKAFGENCLSNPECCSNECDTWLGICGGPRTCTTEGGVNGLCYLFECPSGYVWQGINVPTYIPIATIYQEMADEIRSEECPTFQTCCTLSSNYVSEKLPLLSECEEGSQGINTAIGCIETNDINGLLSFILPWAIGVGGGTSFILIVISGFLVMTSAGDPARARAGKELLTSAIAGMLLIIFSVYILDFIGIRILRIPGL